MKDNKKYDLSLGKWGPYNKDYLGIAHIADVDKGATFQVELVPGFFRRSVLACNTAMDGGLKMWGANARLDRFTYRYELEWKDRVYCDAEFTVSEDRFCTVSCTFCNNTDVVQSINLNLCASLQYPAVKHDGEFTGYRPITEAVCPADTVWIDAVDYDEIRCSCTFASDGKYLGEAIVPDATGKGTAIAGRFFSEPSHMLKYHTAGLAADAIGIRYQAEEDTAFTVSVNGIPYTLSLPACDAFSYVTLSIPSAVVEEIALAPTGAPVTVDGIAIGNAAAEVCFTSIHHGFVPERQVEDNRMYLTYPGIAQSYSIEWHTPVKSIRRFYCNDIGRILTQTVHNHVATELHSALPSVGVYENVFTTPMYLEPGEQKQMVFYLRCGSMEELRAAPAGNETQVSVPAAPNYHVCCNSDGAPYAFSQDMMMYNTFLNVVYPVYTRRGYIRHNTPGRIWDSLYSWDSGFIGMGLATADFTRAYECLNTYLTPVGDIHSPYIFHGSVVPTQVFLYQKLLETYKDKTAELKALYPMMKQYYHFYADLDKDPHIPKSGLLKTWHIFYNSGGWDDYAAQVGMWAIPGGSEYITPVCTTALTVLIAKIMRGIAVEFGYTEDLPAYDAAIEKYTVRIQENLWDEEVGYYSYMVHDAEGHPKEFFRYEDGTNYNCGFDGIYPFIAGIGTEEQRQRMLDNMENGLMTEAGICVVDKRAPYRSTHGYWNGSVWFPHQWILWKALLDNGNMAFANKIADTAISIWAKELNASYCCFEHFMPESKRGSGFHQFSGLSTPVLMFYAAYYTPGTVSVGFMTSLREVCFKEGHTGVKISCVAGGHAPLMIICLKEGQAYTFRVNGNVVSAQKITNGAYVVSLSEGDCIVEAE